MILPTAQQVLWHSCCLGVATFSPLFRVISSTPPAIATPLPQFSQVHSDASLLGTTQAASILPSVSLGYNSDELGSPALTHLDGFFPLWQTPGADLGYLHSRLAVDANGNLGGSVLLGYRRLSGSGRWVRGVYVGFDQRRTDHNQFQQLGFGLEQLGAVDLRLNTYLPIGQVRQAVADTGWQMRDRYFSGHQLNLVWARQQSYEAAATGVDLEVGTQLARWGPGALKGHAGIYYYDLPAANSALGYRVRLSANPQRNLNLGLNIQTDPLFGSRVSFQVGMRWGGRAATSTAAAPLWTRLGESVGRTGAIAIDTQVESFTNTVVATNPDTGAAWHFLHVNPGMSGDGQFATPYATTEEALLTAATRSATENRNTTIYVQDTASPLISTTIPENVRLWSTGPTQQLNTNEFGRVTLPLSGSGAYPLLTNTVRMSDGTHLAGFTITPANPGSEGVSAAGMSNLIIRENRITTAGTRSRNSANGGVGVSLNNSSGFVQVMDNTITTSGELSHGVQLFHNNADLTTATIERNTINTTGLTAQGISILAQDGATITQTDLNENRITTTGAEGNGILAFASAKTGPGYLGQVTIAGNTVTTQGNTAGAVLAFASNGGRVNHTSLSNNTIHTQGAESPGLLAFAAGCQAEPCDGSSPSSQLGSTTITGNRIATDSTYSDGILAFAVKTAQLGSATITGNTVRTQGAGVTTGTITTSNIVPNPGRSGGIMAFASNGSRLESAAIADNQITTTGTNSNGLAVFAVSNDNNNLPVGEYPYAGSTLVSAQVTNNTVTTTQTESSGLLAFATNHSTLQTASLSGNSAATSGERSYGISTFASSSGNLGTFQAQDNQLVTTGSQGHGINLSANGGSTITASQISGNTSTTKGSAAHGVALQVNSGSTLTQATVVNNQLSTTNANADALAVTVQGDGSTLSQGTATGNTLSTQGLASRGLSVLASTPATATTKSAVSSLTLNNNQVTTQGGCVLVGLDVTCADGINTLNFNSTVTGTTQIRENTVTTHGVGAAGIVGSAISAAQTANLTVTGNTVTTRGALFSQGGSTASSLGINISTIAGATLTTNTVSNNTVTTQGELAHGIQLLATGGAISTNTVAQNQITTHGSQAHSIFALANDTGGSIAAASFQDNSSQAFGSNTTGIYTLAAQGGQFDTATFLNNQINQATKNGVLVQTSGSATAALCVDRFTGNKSQTGVTDLTVVQSEGTLGFSGFSRGNVQGANTGFDTIVEIGTIDTATGCP